VTFGRGEERSYEDISFEKDGYSEILGLGRVVMLTLIVKTYGLRQMYFFISTRDIV
jgi:hypothetical protein